MAVRVGARVAGLRRVLLTDPVPRHRAAGGYASVDISAASSQIGMWVSLITIYYVKLNKYKLRQHNIHCP